jgi:tRNA U34 5-methylaminomethyl-2-thiouridine-forming methyltransferase MnmC
MLQLTQSFTGFAPTSRLWVYASTRAFAATELNYINGTLQTFINAWKAHGAELKANYSIEHNQFILIAVDEAQSAATGCSIDKSVHVMQQLEQQLGLQLLDRSLVYYINENNTISNFKFTQAEALIANNIINANTLVLDNTISTLNSAWQVPLLSTWLSRYLVANEVK